MHRLGRLPHQHPTVSLPTPCNGSVTGGRLLFRAAVRAVTVPLRREICVSAQMRTKNACASFFTRYSENRPNTRFEACSARDSPQSLRCRGGTCSPQWVPPPFVKGRRSGGAGGSSPPPQRCGGGSFQLRPLTAVVRPAVPPTVVACPSHSSPPRRGNASRSRAARRLRRLLRSRSARPLAAPPSATRCRAPAAPSRPAPSRRRATGRPRTCAGRVARRVGGRVGAGRRSARSARSGRSRRSRHPDRSPTSSSTAPTGSGSIAAPGPSASPPGSADEAEVRALAVQLIARGGRHIDEATPAVDVRLGRGIRVHAVLPPVSSAGTLISVRVPRAAGFPLAALARAGMFDDGQESLLREAVAARRNLLVTGAGGAGKTTLLAALLGEASHAGAHRAHRGRRRAPRGAPARGRRSRRARRTSRARAGSASTRCCARRCACAPTGSSSASAAERSCASSSPRSTPATTAGPARCTRTRSPTCRRGSRRSAPRRACRPRPSRGRP